MRGVPIDADKEVEFRARYLATGNARKSARESGLPETTGQELANRANADEDFVRLRAKLRARVLPEAEAMLADAMQTMHDRLSEPDPSPADLARIAVEHDLKSFNYSNPKPAYAKALNDAAKVLAAYQAAQGNASDGTRIEVTILPSAKAARDAGRDDE